MKSVRTFAVLAVLLVSMVGCSGSTDPDELTIADIAGTWVSTSFVYIADGNPTLQVDLVDEGGSVTMVISAGGAFTGTTDYPPLSMNLVLTGQMTLSDGTLTQDFDAEGLPTLIWTLTVNGDDSMTMTGAQGPWDFTPDNEIDDTVNADIVAVVVRQ